MPDGEAEIAGGPRESQEAEILKDAKHRARVTRNYLEENGLDYKDAGIKLDSDADFKDDAKLVSAVLKRQAELNLPKIDGKTGQDGMLGRNTFEAHKKSLSPEDLKALQEKIATVKAEQLKQEGAMVTHDKIDEEITTKYGITAKVIEDAQKECQKDEEADKIAERPNFLRLVDYAARVTDVPPAAIIATTYAETSGTFDPDKIDDAGEMGMGQFLKKYWKEYTGDQVFKNEMAKFTTQDPTTVGRARSVVGDLLAIGIKLKQSQRVVGDFHYDSALNEEQLIAMRFHYHAPGYAYAHYKENTHGEDFGKRAEFAYQTFLPRYRDRFAKKALQVEAKTREPLAN